MTCPHVTDGTCSVCEEFAELVKLVRQMRRLQKEYFRSKGGLESCKSAERLVDAALKRIIDRQMKLF